jgi:F-type H+-transporting ATPase subunit b
MAEIFNSLGLDLTSLIVQATGFLLLFLLLSKFLFKPIKEIIQKRESEIKDTFEKIEKEKKEMETLKQEYEEHLEKIEDEHREKVAEFVKEGERIRQEIIDVAHKEAQKIQGIARTEIEREKEKALVTLREDLVNLTIIATKKVVGEVLDETKHRKLIMDVVDKIQRQELRN